MSVRDTETLDFFSNSLKKLNFEKEETKDATEPQRPTQIQKFVPYEVHNDNLIHAIRDLTSPFEILRHFDQDRKSNRKFLAPLRFFGFKTGADVKKTIFNSNAEDENDGIVKFKCKLADVQMFIARRREKGQNLLGIPDIIAESLKGMSIEDYYNLSRNISNLLWLFSDAVRKYQDFKYRCLNDKSRTVYDFCNLSTAFEKIFEQGFNALERPNFAQLSGPNFNNFLKWRSVTHAGPYLYKSLGRTYVVIYVLGQYSHLSIFNCDQPLHGLYMFDASEFKHSQKFEPLPNWFLYRPNVIFRNSDKFSSTFDQSTRII